MQGFRFLLTRERNQGNLFQAGYQLSGSEDPQHNSRLSDIPFRQCILCIVPLREILSHFRYMARLFLHQNAN